MKKILLAEDNSANRLLVGRIISSLGYIAICASDGNKALHTLEDNPDILCVLSDCQMPELDGIGLMQEIRRRKGDTFPVLLYSSYLSVKELGTLIQKGATAVLHYPLTPSQLEEYIKRYIE